MENKKYELRFLPLFENDLTEIVEYISFTLKTPTAAERLVDDVERAINNRLFCAESFEPFYSAKGENILITKYLYATSPFSMWL